MPSRERELLLVLARMRDAALDAIEDGKEQEFALAIVRQCNNELEKEE